MFPLGMYGVGGHYLGQADHLPIVRAIGANESWVALAAWALTFAATPYRPVITLGTTGPVPTSQGAHDPQVSLDALARELLDAAGWSSAKRAARTGSADTST